MGEVEQNLKNRNSKNFSWEEGVPGSQNCRWKATKVKKNAVHSENCQGFMMKCELGRRRYQRCDCRGRQERYWERLLSLAII